MMPSSRPIDEDKLLEIAVDLLERSDRCSPTDAHLSRQYARQAYQLGVHSQQLRRLITEERVRMIARRMQSRSADLVAKGLASVRVANVNRIWTPPRATRLGLVIIAILLSTLGAPTPTNETTTQQKAMVEARFAAAPL
ncbi:MAG: hypothetical protein ACR2Q4_23510 [Geminicoccaceae bacterium]